MTCLSNSMLPNRLAKLQIIMSQIARPKLSSLIWKWTQMRGRNLHYGITEQTNTSPNQHVSDKQEGWERIDTG